MWSEYSDFILRSKLKIYHAFNMRLNISRLFYLAILIYLTDQYASAQNVTSSHRLIVPNPSKPFENSKNSQKIIFPPYEKEAEINELTHILVAESFQNNSFVNIDKSAKNETKRSRGESGRSLSYGISTALLRFTKAIDLGRVVREIETSVMTSVSCTACRAGVGLLLHYVESGRSDEEIATAATKLCINLKMASPRVCAGIIQTYIGEVTAVLRSTVLESFEICAQVVGESCSSKIPPSLQWSVNFPPIPKPPVPPIYPTPPPGSPRLKVVQISDTHWDPYYEPGSNADCNEPLCCRIKSGPRPPRAHLGAGLWGDYRKCDTPRKTMESMFKQIAEEHHDIDYILWTGDIPAHDVWNQTHASNIASLRSTVDLFLQYFPHIPIFPALGNHEGAPVNSFPPPWVQDPEYSIEWLYGELMKEWANWLPSTTLKTVRDGAYYSTLVKKGFKIISLNMNYCNNKNWWLLVNSTDPSNELSWLIYELQSSEIANEKVHIIGHIPPGHADCMQTWSRNYYNIVSRYESTIVAQFFGHTHFDEFELFYAVDEPYRPTSIAYVGPSVTPYYNLNPGYRVYYVDGDYTGSTRSVVDHETWVTDLGEANRIRATELTWYKLYSAKDGYKLQDLSPASWDDIVMKMYKDKKLFKRYYNYYYKNSPVAPECDEECKNRLLCDMRSGKSHASEELCKPRPNSYKRSSRDSYAIEKPSNGILSSIWSYTSSSISSVLGFFTNTFG